MGDKIHDIFNNEFFMMLVNIGISIAMDHLSDWFGDKILDKLDDKSNYWSYSDIKFYCILHKSLFKLINQGIIPYATYIFDAKIIKKNNDDDYSNLVSKMFVFLEMNGFGYPIIDLIYIAYKNFKDMKEKDHNEINIINVKNEIADKTENKKGLSQYELHKAYKKKKMNLDDNYADVLAIYWITMFYLPIYPIGIIQSFLNLLFKFITEKNFLSNIYKRPSYINPHFGFLCFNFFNFGFFLFLLGNLIFFKNEDNKSCFGSLYIIFMTFVLIFPFYYIAKLLVNCCCCSKKIRIEFILNKEITVLISKKNEKFIVVQNKYIKKLSLNPQEIIFNLNSLNGIEINPEEKIDSQMNESNRQRNKIEVYVRFKNGNKKEDVNTNEIKNETLNINENEMINGIKKREKIIIDDYKL